MSHAPAARLTLLGLCMAAACRTAPAPELQRDTDDADHLIGDVVDDNEAKLARVASGDVARRGSDVHFAGLSNESLVDFCTRADERIAELDREHEFLVGREDLARDESLNEARAALTEARADLEQVRTMSGPVFDDGRLGVSVAINRAQRQLVEARDGLTDARL